MPFKMEEITSGSDNGKFRVLNTDTGEVKAGASTKEKAEAQLRLLRGIEAGTLTPRGSKKFVPERETVTGALSNYFQVNIDEAQKAKKDKKPKKGEPGYIG